MRILNNIKVRIKPRTYRFIKGGVFRTEPYLARVDDKVNDKG